ncbi:MAG: hypothetical protein KDJ87_16570 [Rhizobiaceae bacterium]|nr:hypothetical protein [Rhizobiaceae bacterium]
MTTVHIKNDLTGQFNIEASDSTVILHKGVTIDSAANGVDEAATFSGSTIVIAGNITTSGLFSTGIRSRGAGADITVAETGRLSGAYGITATGDNALVVNEGRIVSENRAILINGEDSRFINHGTTVSHSGAAFETGQVASFAFLNDGRMVGKTGLDFHAGDLKAVFGEDSVVKAGNHTIVTNTADGDTARIVNHGTLAATVEDTFPEAIVGGAGSENIRNDGLIRGQVILGDGADRYDGRGGRVTDGVVEGGAGNDQFYLSDGGTRVVEGIGGGYDRLTVSFSYKLEAFNEIEEIRLAGRGDFRLTGNMQNNYLVGNASDNRLFGGDGQDGLFGGKGDDILTGGAGGDGFYFKPHAGRETVTDFTDGEDFLVFVPGKDITDMQDLLDHHLKQTHGGLLISGDGTEMLLKGMHKADLGFDDFIT